MTAELRGADRMVSKEREYSEERGSPGGMTEELLTSRSVEIAVSPPPNARVSQSPGVTTGSYQKILSV